jgi:hypothetical protein
MSKFIKALKQTSQPSPAPIGFHGTQAARKPRIMLVASVAQPGKDVSALVTGADAVVFSAAGPDEIKDYAKKIKDTEIPAGIMLADDALTGGKTPEIEGDFIIFPPKTPLFELKEKMGRIMVIDINIADSLLRAIDDLPLDAVYVPLKAEGAFSWQDLAAVQRMDNICPKPLLVRVPATVTGSDLATLWKVGADGVVIEVSAADAGKMKELREAADKTDFPLPRRTKKAEVSLPFIRATVDEEDEEEPDEE